MLVVSGLPHLTALLAVAHTCSHRIILENGVNYVVHLATLLSGRQRLRVGVAEKNWILRVFKVY